MPTSLPAFAATSSLGDQKVDRIDIRLKVVEAHMTGFMSSAKYLETEIDSLRGRVEAIEAHIQRGQGPS